MGRISWRHQHHNIVICMLAHAFLAAGQARLLRQHRDQDQDQDTTEAADQGKVP